MSRGPFGGPRPFASNECFPAKQKRFPQGAVDYSRVKEVADFQQKIHEGGALEDDDKDALVHAYQLNKPMAMLHFYGFEPQASIMDKIENRLKDWFFTHRMENPNPHPEDPYYFDDYVFISRFKALIQLVEGEPFHDGSGDFNDTVQGILLGYDPHNVAGFIQKRYPKEFR